MEIGDNMTEIKQIRTITMVKQDEDCRTLEMTKNFLTKVIFEEREGHFHLKSNPIAFKGRTLILFKYDGVLIGKGIIVDYVEDDIEEAAGETYDKYVVFEEGSTEIFDKPIVLDELIDAKIRKESGGYIKSLSRDQIIHIKDLDKINKLIEEHT